MRSFFRICCSLLWLATVATTARADEDIPPSPIVKTALSVDAPAITADSTVWAAVTFTIPDHWHIYWQNPGDSGIPTTLAWTLPPGLTAGDISWPMPERIETSGLIAYGYSHQVTLPVPLTASQANAHGPLNVTAKWLVCRDVCVPETAVLTANLPTETANAKKIIEDAVMQAPTPAVHSNAVYQQNKDTIMLTVRGPELFPKDADALTKASFIPQEDGIITNGDVQMFKISPSGDGLMLTFKRGTQDLPQTWHGIIQLTRGASVKNYSIAAELHGGAMAAASSPLPTANAVSPSRPTPATPTFTTPVSFFTALALAFLGGLVLNIMPCVLPILALKALAITKKAQASRAAAAQQGLAYTAGVVVSFLAIAGLMLSLKASGAAIGWGFQLQHSGFVAVLALIMLLVSANLLGLFELPVLFGTRASQTNDNKMSGSFLTGALAVLVATPCSAPFMATAIGATLALPAAQALIVFLFLGLGMAFPFLLISFWPAARRILPKPGRWMVRFKQILAIPMLATAAWLIWVLVQLQSPSPAQTSVPHEIYSAATLKQLRDAGTPVFVDATAAWCLTCKVNERVALHSDGMQQFLQEKKVTLMVADWTANDLAITAYLAEFGRNGVPLYVYYGPHAEPVVLPQILTPTIVRDAVNSSHK